MQDDGNQTQDPTINETMNETINASCNVNTDDVLNMKTQKVDMSLVSADKVDDDCCPLVDCHHVLNPIFKVRYS